MLQSYFIFVCSHLAICWDAETKLNRIKTIVLWLVFTWYIHSEEHIPNTCCLGSVNKGSAPRRRSTSTSNATDRTCEDSGTWRPSHSVNSKYSYHYCLAGYPVRSFGVPLLIWDNCHVKIKDQIDHISFLQIACNYGNLKIHLNHFINLSIPVSDGIWFLQGVFSSEPSNTFTLATSSSYMQRRRAIIQLQITVTAWRQSTPNITKSYPPQISSNCVTKALENSLKKNPECLVRILRMEQTWQTLAWRSV